MHDAHEVLGLAADADGATIRRRYLELVRQYPPEIEPAKAAEIRNAYEALRDPRARLEQQLFGLDSPHTVDALAASCRPEVRGQRFPTGLLMSLGQL